MNFSSNENTNNEDDEDDDNDDNEDERKGGARSRICTRTIYLLFTYPIGKAESRDRLHLYLQISCIKMPYIVTALPNSIDNSCR
jgi:hypothetical protein